VELPGFNDVNRSDVDTLGLIAFHRREASQELVRVHFSGLIYLHSINDDVWTASSIMNMSLFQAICGDRHIPSVVVATSQWEIADPEISAKRFGELQDPKSVWQAYIAAGRQVCKVSDDTSRFSSLITEVLATNQRRTFSPQL
jgi:hypothetical protein